MMTTEERLRFQREMLDGKPIDQERFQRGMEMLLPDARDGAIAGWAEFAKECVDMKQYVDYTAEPNATAACRWHDTLLASFLLLMERSGRDAAAKVCELSLYRCCLYPWEMERAAEELQKGTAPDSLSHMMENGELETGTAEFPKLQEILDSISPSHSNYMNIREQDISQSQGPEMTMQ